MLKFSDIVSFFAKESHYSYQKDGGIYPNPLTGYAPDAGYEELAEKYQLVYMGITWKELESEEGVFNWDEIEERGNFARWKKQGKKLVLRFICDLPGDEEHMDIPKWLHDKTGDGSFYDIEYGKGYCPDYNNEIFIEAHAKVIKEIGKHFWGTDFLAYVELGSLGHWGEWHTFYQAGIPRMPLGNVRERYVKAYTESFPYARLLMRRPFEELPMGAGVFNDMTGYPEDTKEWLDWINNGGSYDETDEKHAIKAVPDIWSEAPVGGEFTSGIPMERMLGADLPETISLISKSHMTFIGPMIPDVVQDSSLTEASEKVLKHVGYRYMVSSMKMKKGLSETKITVTIHNDGTAPIYFDYVPCIYIENPDGSDGARYEIPIDLKGIFQGQEESAVVMVPSDSISEKGTKIYAGIEDPATNTAAVYLTMKAQRSGRKSLLWER